MYHISPRWAIIFLESFLTIFYYFVEFFSKSAFLNPQENINEILSHLHVLKNFLCCSIFKEQVPTESCLSKSACLLYQKLFRLSRPFWKFFWFFSKMFFSHRKTAKTVIFFRQKDNARKRFRLWMLLPAIIIYYKM